MSSGRVLAIEHDTSSPVCWCPLTYWVPCEDCDVAEYRGAALAILPAMPDHPGCLRCEHGLIPLYFAALHPADATIVIVHTGAP